MCPANCLAPRLGDVGLLTGPAHQRRKQLHGIQHLREREQHPDRPALFSIESRDAVDIGHRRSVRTQLTTTALDAMAVIELSPVGGVPASGSYIDHSLRIVTASKRARDVAYPDSVLRRSR
jgi:hypothetical protein